MPAKNVVQSSHPGHFDTSHQTKPRPHKQDDPTGYAETLALNHSAPLHQPACIVLYRACALSRSLSLLQNGWMQEGEREGGKEGGSK